MQMQRKSESQQKENKFLKFYLGGSSKSWRSRQAWDVGSSVRVRT